MTLPKFRVVFCESHSLNRKANKRRSEGGAFDELEPRSEGYLHTSEISKLIPKCELFLFPIAEGKLQFQKILSKIVSCCFSSLFFW